MNISFVLWLLFASLAVFVRKGLCVNSWMPWNWSNKPRPVDGQWSSWSTWSTCQITSDPETMPFRYKERNCSNPAPKNGGAECKGESRRTSTCYDCNIPLGLESGRIPDSFMTALHSHAEFPASAARLNGKSAWCSMNPESLEEPLYLQIELKKLTKISAIASQGFYPEKDALSLRMGRVSKYQLTYSTDGLSWKLYKDNKNETILRGNKKRNGTVLNILTPEITAQFIRVFPLSYFSFICMRLELYGCTFGCGGALGEEPGDIITKSSPAEDQDCLWHVNLPNITKLNLDFINFNIPCSNGYTELRDGDMPYSAATVVAQYCGYDRPPPLVSSNSGKLWVRFRSNASDTQVGFYAVYFPGCGEHLHGRSGEVKSPNFPREYFHNSKCIWTITVSQGKSVRLKFVEFNVEGGSNRHRCPHDHLTIWNGSDSTALLIGKFCNSNPPPSVLCSSGNTLRLKFRSDDALAWRGFYISYSEVDPQMPCSELSSTVLLTTSSRPSTIISIPLTPTPSITSEIVFTQQAVFSTSNYLAGFTTKTTTGRLNTSGVKVLIPVEATSIETTSTVMANWTVSFTGTSVNGELQAAAQRKQKDDDDEDDGLTTVIILSAFAFLVICMIVASIVPSLKKHCEGRKGERQMSLMVAASLSIPETNSKDTFEVVPIALDDKMIPVSESVACEAVSYEESLQPVETAESESLSETPTVEFSNEQNEGVMETEVPSEESDPNCGEEKSIQEKMDELNDIPVEQEQSETNADVAVDVDDAPEVGSLRMSYEDLGSSFACEMQAMLSQFVDDDEMPTWNLSTSANAENSLQDSGPETEGSAVKELEISDGIPQAGLSTQDDAKSVPSSEALVTNTSDDPEDKLEMTSDRVSAEMTEIWEVQPDYVSSHSRRNTAGENRVSGSCTDSKDSGCASSSENLQMVDNHYPYAGSNETCV